MVSLKEVFNKNHSILFVGNIPKASEGMKASKKEN